MKTAIVFFSFSGNNRVLAERLSDELQADLFEITEPRKRGPFRIMMDMAFRRNPRINPLTINWEPYDQLLLLSPVWNLAIAHPMKSFIKKNHHLFPSYSFATLCGGRDGQQQHLYTQLYKWTQRSPKLILQFELRELPVSAGETPPTTGYQVRSDELDVYRSKIQRLLRTFQTQSTPIS